MEDIEDFVENQLEKSAFVRPYEVKYKQNGISKIWHGIRSHDSIAVIIHNVDKHCLVLVKQFRPVVYLANLDAHKSVSPLPGKAGITMELCAGIIDKEKTWAEIAIDEIYEECGYKVNKEDLEYITTVRSNVGLNGAKQALYYVKADEALLGVKKSSCDNVAIGISFPVPLRDNPSFSSIETSHSAVIYHGRLLRDEYEQSNAYFIIIEDSNEVNSLWHQGYYGYAPHKAEFLQPLNNDSEEFNFVKRIRLEADSTNSHCHYLLLSILEACYLMHVFNCLEVKCSTSDKAITLDELWQLVYFNFNFPSLYAAYGYYRSKGWIVKHGLRLGCDLLLYAIGPPFHHAAHCVKVLLQQSNQLKTLSGNCFIMKDLLTVSRVAHGVSKNLLLCTVKWTDNAPTNAIDCVQSMQIVDCSINRFVPKQSSSNADEI